MKKFLVAATALVGALTLTLPAHAQTTTPPAPAPAAAPSGGLDFSFNSAPVGKEAGTFMVRLRAIGVIPENFSSSITPIGGTVGVTATAAPEVDLSYFFTDNIAVEAIAASTKHTITANNTVIGNVPVGTAWVLPPTVTLQYHFMPHEQFSPYLGVGLSVDFFYATQPAGPPISKFGLSTTAGPAIQAGFDYNFAGHWFLNFDVKQLFVNTTARINGGTIIAKTALSPTIVGAGIGYRF